MNKTSIHILIPLLLCLSVGCETDPEAPLARTPYPVVYCVLDINDTAHYVRLTKTFSGPIDPDSMAQNPDSLYYKHARVTMELMDGAIIDLEPTWEVQRDSGTFFYDYSVLYKTTVRLCGPVRLVIYLPEYGTEILGHIMVLPPRTFTAPNPQQNKVLGFYEPEPVRIVWNGIEDACHTTIRFKYLEITDTRMDTCFVDWIRKGSDIVLISEELLEHLSKWIPEDSRVSFRKVVGFDLIATTGDKDLADYMLMKDWGIDIIEKPYSNLVNAYGLIASRVTTALTDYLPNQKFIDTLVNSSLTRHLKFVGWLEE
jgi:hypothetical protein